MGIAVMTYSFSRSLASGEQDLAGVIRCLRDLGVNSIELMDSLIRQEEVTAVREVLTKTGMTVVCYDLVCDVATADRAERKMHVGRFRERLGQAAALGARQVLVVPGLPGEGVEPSVTRQWFCEALRASRPEASRLGLTLTVENLGIQADLYGRSEHILAICEAVGPELKVTFDAGNFLLAGEDNLAALDHLSPRLAHVHLKDWTVVSAGTPSAYPAVDRRFYQGAPLGDGVVNLHGVVGRLKRLGYRGAISVEYEGPGDPEEAVCRGLTHLRGLLDVVRADD